MCAYLNTFEVNLFAAATASHAGSILLFLSLVLPFVSLMSSSRLGRRHRLLLPPANSLLFNLLFVLTYVDSRVFERSLLPDKYEITPRTSLPDELALLKICSGEPQ